MSGWVGAELVHRDVGVLIITIGDYEAETVLLDPLAKSVLQFCRLLVPDDQVKAFKLRSVDEFKFFWSRDQAAYSHVVLIAHGSQNGIKFGVDDWINPTRFEDALKVKGASPKTFISLCCQTGYKSFGGCFSKLSICRGFIAPFHSVHGAVASQFCQTFLTSHFIEGKARGWHSSTREALSQEAPVSAYGIMAR
jgi:hypothetical protein